MAAQAWKDAAKAAFLRNSTVVDFIATQAVLDNAIEAAARAYLSAATPELAVIHDAAQSLDEQAAALDARVTANTARAAQLDADEAALAQRTKAFDEASQFATAADQFATAAAKLDALSAKIDAATTTAIGVGAIAATDVKPA